MTSRMDLPPLGPTHISFEFDSSDSIEVGRRGSRPIMGSNLFSSGEKRPGWDDHSSLGLPRRLLWNSCPSQSNWILTRPKIAGDRKKTALVLFGFAMLPVGLYFATLTPARVICTPEGSCTSWDSPPLFAYFPNIFGVTILISGVLLIYKSAKRFPRVAFGSKRSCLSMAAISTSGSRNSGSNIISGSHAGGKQVGGVQ